MQRTLPVLPCVASRHRARVLRAAVCRPVRRGGYSIFNAPHGVGTPMPSRVHVSTCRESTSADLRQQRRLTRDPPSPNFPLPSRCLAWQVCAGSLATSTRTRTSSRCVRHLARRSFPLRSRLRKKRKQHATCAESLLPFLETTEEGFGFGVRFNALGCRRRRHELNHGECYLALALYRSRLDRCTENLAGFFLTAKEGGFQACLLAVLLPC